MFLASRVTNQDFERATFAELGNAPASLEASRVIDFFACLPGHDGEGTDGIQAYCQARLLGAKCWIALPPDAVVDKELWASFDDPVTLMELALYGHVDSPTSWEVHCDERLG